MTDLELSNILADALAYASIPGFRDSANEESFRSGNGDLAMSELEIDSLAAMELCIAIEINTGVTLTPADLGELLTLGDLLAKVRTLRDA